jgi:hypothetical protein
LLLVPDRKDGCATNVKRRGWLAADIGTKVLPESQFCLLRDINNGYGLVKHYLPTRKIPTMVVDPWKKIEC